MKQFIISLLLLSQLYSWGETGHRSIGHIAELNLSFEAKQEILRLLDGESLARVSTWPDDIKADPMFKQYGQWHYINLPLDKEWFGIERLEGGDIMSAIDTCITILKDNVSTKEVKAFHLKFLVHLVGDIHQPMHTGRYEDWGGNKIEAQWYGHPPTNLHLIWDSNMIEHYNLSYTELSKFVIDEHKDMEVFQGTSEDWVVESHNYVRDIYNDFDDPFLNTYDKAESYMYKNFPLVKKRLYQGGIRLAGVLNGIYK